MKHEIEADMTENEKLQARATTLMERVKFMNYYIIIVESPVSGVHMRAIYEEPDTYTGRMEEQYTRRWNLTPLMTDSEIVQTAFKMCLTSMEHRAREAFQYKGARIFGPHFDVEDLVQLCQTRENAGGRA